MDPQVIFPYFERRRKIVIVLIWFYSCMIQLQSYLFSDLSYENLLNQSLALQTTTSEFALIQTAEELYHIPRVKSEGFECSPVVIRITDKNSLGADVWRPQMFVSGEIHGDERVGPQTSLVTSQLLTHSAQCIIEKNKGACDFLQQFQNLTSSQLKWLTFLATRRDTIIVPTANCLGYKLNRREDNGIDPNRDFAYTRKDNKCFLSTTAKIIYAIMKENIIQTVVTFHGGMVAIGYEWGSPNHHAPKDASPDHSAYSHIGKVFALYGGKFKKEKQYPVGGINSVIYPVDGGMEDWLYAEGWDPTYLRKDCIGYANLPMHLAGHFNVTHSNHESRNHRARMQRNKLRIRKMLHVDSVQSRNLVEDSNGNRALVFLVETSNLKRPQADSLGGTANILNPTASENGHIPRNVRLTLSAIDLLQPYTCFQSLRFFHADNLINRDSKQKELYLTADWYVGGAIDVDETFLALHSFGVNAPPVSTTRDFTAYLQAISHDEELERFLFSSADKSKVRRNDSEKFGEESLQILSSIQKGSTRWDSEHLNNLSSNLLSNEKNHFFQSSSIYSAKSIPLQQLLLENIRSRWSENSSTSPTRTFSFWLIAWSKVDSSYGNKGQGYPNELPPQSHYSNLRTNRNWSCGFIGKDLPRSCQGRKYWPSDFIEIQVDLNNSKIFIMEEILDCAWWDYHLPHKAPYRATSFPLPPEWKLAAITPTSPPANLASSTIKQSVGSSTLSPSPSSLRTIAPSFNQYQRNESSMIFIPYHVFYQSKESNFFGTERIYLLICLLLTIIVTVGSMLINHWRRNRIYSALINNRYLSLPTGFQR